MKIMQIHERDLAVRPDATLDPQSAVCSDRGGGLAVYMARIIDGLRHQGQQVSVIEFNPHGQNTQQVASRYHRLRASRFRFRPKTIAAFWQVIEKEDPDLVHMHTIFHELSPRTLGRLMQQRPVIWTTHDVKPVCFWGTKLHPDDRLCEQPVGVRCVTSGCYRLGAKTPYLSDVVRVLSNPLYLRMYRRLPAVLVPSGYVKSLLLDNGFRENRVKVVPLFSRFEPCEISESNDAAVPQILFVGRLDHKKGVEQLIEALALLKASDWEAVVVGDGDLLPVAQALAADYGIDQRVTFIKHASIEQLKQCYRSCALLVFPSLIAESFGLVGVEAMSFAKPVVGFACGGVTEWLRDSVNGLLVGHGNVPGLAQAIDRLLTDASLRATLGDNALKSVRERYVFEQHLDQILNTYRETVDDFRKNHGES